MSDDVSTGTRLGWRVASAVDLDRHLLSKIATRESGLDYIDCTNPAIAAGAIQARHEWGCTALAVLRWLLAPWPDRSSVSHGSTQPTDADPAITRKQGEPGAEASVKGDRK